MYCVGIWAGVGTVVGLFGLWHWVADLVAQFRPQYLLVVAPLALVEALRRRFRNAAVFGALAVINAIFVAPAYVPARGADPDAARLRVLLANVHILNDRYGAVLDLVRDTDPDVVLLQEPDDLWVAGVAGLTNTHPHTFIVARGDCYGMAVYSRRPLAGADAVRIGEGWVPSIHAQFEADGSPLHLIGVHAVPPANREASRMRNEFLDALPGYLAGLEGAKVVIGDLNATPGSWHYRRLLQRSGLRSSRDGRGIQPTWPAPLPRVFRIPIDDALLSPEIAVTDRRLGPFIGSDHYPIILDIVLSRP
jgi:endonuclease/exonuclease/phosphatase (EEP) superfamily protein YafD